jgi:hypothetical protein
MIVVLCVSPSRAEDIPLYKEYSFGQSKAEIKAMKGVVSCGQNQSNTLCLGGQPFAGFSWVQVFSFRSDKLVQVDLRGGFSPEKYTRTTGAILNNGYVPVHLQSGNHEFDFFAEAKARGKDVATASLYKFEQQALDHGHIRYTFIPKSITGLASKSDTFANFIQDSPEDMRTVEMEIKDDLSRPWIAVRFFAVKATRQLVGAEMLKSSDEF